MNANHRNVNVKEYAKRDSLSNTIFINQLKYVTWKAAFSPTDNAKTTIYRVKVGFNNETVMFCLGTSEKMIASLHIN